MTKDIIIKNCTLDEFSKMFGTRKEYERLLQEMPLKERIFSQKPTNKLEESLKNSIIDKALIKLGSSMLHVTSYSVKKDNDSNTVYISYGGKGQRIGVGRTDDHGGFFYAAQHDKDIQLNIKTRYEHYMTWYILAVIIGFMFFIIPGAIMVIYFSLNHFMDSRAIDKNIIPVIVKTFESKI